jgi:penicillin-insensitive murein endopeptidase
VSAAWIALWLTVVTTPDGGVSDGGLPAVPAAWSALKAPLRAPAAAVGGYSNGCLQGAVPLPTSGPGYEVLHLRRHRAFGHPELVGYIRHLGQAVKKQRLGLLLVGDMAQPRGGPTPTGHKSHQTGLDVDIGYAYPPWAARRRPTAAEREALGPPPVVNLPAGSFTPLWQPRVATLLQVAASDPAVDRIFVNPAIKRELCAHATAAQLPWLRKLRPWWGHHDHFHVRLRCPPTSLTCVPQDPLPPDDGCHALAWWFSADAQKTQEKKAAEQAAGPPPLPDACRSVLEGK